MADEDAIRRSYAPTGRLRVALNCGNRVLVGRDGAGHAIGISVDIARALASVIGCDLQFVEYDRAADVSGSAADDAWDVCFLAADPDRATTIDFTPPYVRISGCYLVAAGVEIESADDVAGRGLRIGVVEGSAYTLHLSRQGGAEHLAELPTFSEALDALDAGDLDGLAGIEQVMADEAKRRPGARVLQPPFMQIMQAMGMPAGRGAATDHLAAFLKSSARNGTIGSILERHGVSARCAVVPAED